MPTLSQNAVRPDNPKSDSPLRYDALEHGKIRRKEHETPSRHNGLKSSLPSIQTSPGPRVNHSRSTNSPSFLPSPPMSASPSNNSTMSHIRRWTSGLATSSKKCDIKPPSKSRTIGPISAPQPLTTPVPYACTPLPYSDDTLTTPITPPSSLNDDFWSQATRSPSISKPVTSCPDLNSSSKKIETPSISEQFSGGLHGRNQKGGWKNRLFNNSNTATKKPDNRSASTNSTGEDEFDWSEKDDDKECNADAKTTSISVIETSNSEVPPPSPRTAGRPKARISPPVSRPTFPLKSSQKKPAISAPLMSPTDDMLGPDSFDPFRVVPRIRHALPAIAPSIYNPPTRSVVDTLSDPESATTSSSIAPTRPLRVRYPSASSTFSEIFKLSSATDFDSKDKHDSEDESESESEAEEDDEEEQGEGVLDFATTLCKGLGSDFVMPPSYFDQHNLNLDFNESYPLKHSIRGQVSAEERASKSLSNCSLDSVSSTGSDDSDSSSDSDASSPISGASFFSTPPNSVHVTALSTTLSSELLKSSRIKIPSSLMTLLPIPKDKSSPSTTPPVTPPLEHVEAMVKNMTILGQPAPGIIIPMADPRATTLKRLASVHTLRKLRERERRPFRHAVLLHLILLQLSRGVTNKHCAEIAEFYITMSGAQFPLRLDLSNAITAKKNLQQQASGANPTPFIDDVLTVPNRTSSKVPPKAINTTKEVKTRKSLVFSIQSRIQSSKAQSDSPSNEASESAPERPRITPVQPSKLPSPSPSLTFKDRLPLLRMPSYPLINLDKKKSLIASSTTSSTSTKSSESSQASEKDEPSSPVESRPTPTIIIPKRTTGRKGVLYQQQLQLQLRQQMAADPAFFMMRSSQDPTAPLDSVAAAWINAQLGARPSFASSTFTTIHTRSELVTKPLVSPSAVKIQQPAMVVPPERPRSLSPPPFAMASSYGPDPWKYYYGAPHPPRLSYFESAPSGPSPMASSTMGPFDQEVSDKNAAPAGLLTPPLSPLFRPMYSPGYAPQQNPAYSESEPVSLLVQPRAYRALKRESAPASFISASSSTMMMTFTGPVSVPASAGRTTPTTPPATASVSSYTLPRVQNSHHTISYLEDQAMHTRNVNSHRAASLGLLEGRRPLSPTSPTSSSSPMLSSSGSTASKVDSKAALPSPPLSPTMESEQVLSSLAVSPAGDAKQSQQKSASLSRQNSFKREYHFQANGYAMPQQQRHQAIPRVMGGGKSENIPWIHGIKKKAEKEEEEDVPLALVQRRLSSDLLRSM
ncbi:hypothetical protein BG006_008401 [Podila minutissima]|uniref:Uncharacterized protein n=1 Tax=Podila minutissima TaxID=64525 RepID=A0A9P5SIF3_9FUNG|nr:hypothetical protein BG006_008401 [Podila minutissima]